jgi:ribosomal protein L11 methyltransferase
MLEGLPPNNAAHRLTLVSDERRARAVADLIVENFEPASTVFETEDRWPGGGKAWLVEAFSASSLTRTRCGR